MLDLDFMLTDTPSGPPGNYTDALTLTLGLTRAGVDAAPSPVWFEVTSATGAHATGPVGGDVYDPQFHDIVYIWEFDDAANATPSTTAALNMPTAWKDINKGYGREVGHVFNDPGTYTVTCTAYEPATRRKGSATIAVTVADPNVTFPTTQTIIYDPNGTADTSAYVGADVQTTWAGVTTARNTLGYVSDARILLASDVTLVGERLARIPEWSNTRFGPVDPNGAKPVIGPGNLEEAAIWDKRLGSFECVVYGLSFVGRWDSTSETGVVAGAFRIDRTSEAFVGTYLFMTHRCDFTGFREVGGVTAGRAGQKYFNFLSECSMTDWQNYGIHGGITDCKTAIIGCSAAQHADALSGGPKDNLHNNHGSIRDFGSDALFVSVCDLFARNGWSAGGTGLNGENITADQACLRINTSGLANRFSNIDRVAMEGTIWIEEQDSTRIDVPGNHVLDKVLQVIGSRAIGEAVEARHGGCTFRNFLGVKLEGPHAGLTNHLSRWFLITNQNGNAENTRTPMQMHNCTFIDKRNEVDISSPVSFWDAGKAPNFDTVTEENNINHQPNRDTPVNAAAPIDMTTAVAGFAPRHKGPRYNFQLERGVFDALVAGAGGTFTIPYAVIRDTVSQLGTVAQSGNATWTNGSATVTGTGTSWLTDAHVGVVMANTSPGSVARNYTVLDVVSDTEIILTSQFQGVTTTDTNYSFKWPDTGAATNQAYWTALSEGGHRMRITDTRQKLYTVADSQFSVAYDASFVTITNTSGVDWNVGAGFDLRLDRRSRIQPFDPALSSVGKLVPTGQPLTGSKAIGDGDMGLHAYDDFLGTERPATGNERGARLR